MPSYPFFRTNGKRGFIDSLTEVTSAFLETSLQGSGRQGNILWPLVINEISLPQTTLGCCNMLAKVVSKPVAGSVGASEVQPSLQLTQFDEGHHDVCNGSVARLV